MKFEPNMLIRLRAYLRAVAPIWLRAAAQIFRSGALRTPGAAYSFSQEGEDLLLARIFGGQKTGFFVDVGSHHPTRFSNTYLLYRRGWRGINIDPTPGVMDEFERLRPRDINLEMAVSSVAGPRVLYVFDEPALNSVDERLSNDRDRHGISFLANRIEVEASTLESILAEHMPRDIGRIDVMSIDVEGHDMEVMRSNDWDRFRPRVLLVELLDTAIDDLEEREETVFLRDRGYRAYAKLVHTVVFRDSRDSD